jgi:hypothetical protein
MGASEQIRQNCHRCGPHLARLRLLAQHPAAAPANSRVVHQASRAAQAVLAEVNAGYRAALGRAAGGTRPGGHHLLLPPRLARLREAAGETVAAASVGDAVALRQQVRRFESLTSAIWPVLLSAAAPPRSRTEPRRAATAVAGPPAGVVAAARGTPADGLPAADSCRPAGGGRAPTWLAGR